MWSDVRMTKYDRYKQLRQHCVGNTTQSIHGYEFPMNKI